MSAYYVLYVIVASGVPICFINDIAVRKVTQKLYFACILISLSCFAAIRSPYIDRDYQEYVAWFQAIASGTVTSLGWLRDPAFALLSYVASMLGFSFSMVCLIYALLGIGAARSVSLFFPNQRWATLYFYLLFCQFYIVWDMTEIRTAVAIPLMALSIYMACNKQRKKALVLYLIALAFHFSVVIALPILVALLAGIQFTSRIWIYFLAGLGSIMSMTLSRVVAFLSGLYRISEYLNGGAEEGDLQVISWYALAHLLVIVAGVVLWAKLSIHQRVAILLSGLGLSLFIVFGANTGLATRFLYMCDIYWLLIVVVVLEKLRGNKRFLYVALIIACGFALYVKSFQYISSYTTVFN